MVEEFTEINRVMEKTGNFTMQRKKLFQLVGKANSNLADVIIRLGLFDRYACYTRVLYTSYLGWFHDSISRTTYVKLNIMDQRMCQSHCGGLGRCVIQVARHCTSISHCYAYI